MTTYATVALATGEKLEVLPELSLEMSKPVRAAVGGVKRADSYRGYADHGPALVEDERLM